MYNTVKVDLGKDSYDIILSDNFVESIENFSKKLYADYSKGNLSIF